MPGACQRSTVRSSVRRLDTGDRVWQRVVMTRLVERLLLPPGSLVLLGLAVTLLLLLEAYRGRRTTARLRLAIWLSLSGAGLLYALSTDVAAGTLLRPLENRHSFAAEAVNVDFIVVLGGGVEVQPGPDGAREVPSRGSLARLNRALELARELTVPVVLAGGRGPGAGQGSPEAAIGAAYLQRMGLPAERLLRESDSQTTWENARNVVAALAPRRLLLVTSAYHMPRAVLAFRSAGVTEVLTAPGDYRAQPGAGTWLDWLPNGSALHDSTTALREYVGLGWYQFRAWIGREQ